MRHPRPLHLSWNGITLPAGWDKINPKTGEPSEYAVEALTDKQLKPPLFMGFVENFEAIKAETALDFKSYMVTLPPEAVRHIQLNHQFDGGRQRAILPSDYWQMMPSLLSYDAIAIGSTVNKMHRIVVTKRIGKELFKWVFEVRPGKSNRVLTLVTLSIKN